MTTSTAEGSGQAILVIEEEERVARLVAWALGLAGFDVTTAADGRQGLALAHNRSFKLVILDLLLPDIDGLAAVDGIRARRPDQQIMILSALNDVRSKVRCLDLGVCDYITKPFELSELVARVQLRLRERGRTDRDRYLRRNGCELDLQRRTVTAGSETIRLTAREFVLLECMMRSSGEVCTREELHENVWGYTFDPATNILDVYVARLRGKLGHSTIQTIRNVGYSFVGSEQRGAHGPLSLEPPALSVDLRSEREALPRALRLASCTSYGFSTTFRQSSSLRLNIS
jgi:two-component system OmpR family response regulator